MDIKKLEEMREPSAIKMAKENQARLDSIYQSTGATDNLLKIAKDLDYSKRLTGNIATQDLLSELSKTFFQNNLVIDDSITEMAKKLTESNSLNTRLFESVKLNKALVDAFEVTQLGLKPRTQFILPEGFISKSQIDGLSSVISKATEAFKQYDKFSALESFKAISSLKNFPFEAVVRNNFDDSTELKESPDENILELDLEISERLSLVDDFNDLSIENQSFLLSSYRTYYYPIILNCLIILMWLQAFLDERLDLTNHTFTLIEKSKEKLSYISNVYRPNPSAMIDNFVVGGTLMLLAKILGW